jgi:hypothetical protein
VSSPVQCSKKTRTVAVGSEAPTLGKHMHPQPLSMACAASHFQPTEDKTARGRHGRVNMHTSSRTSEHDTRNEKGLLLKAGAEP